MNNCDAMNLCVFCLDQRSRQMNAQKHLHTHWATLVCVYLIMMFVYGCVLCNVVTEPSSPLAYHLQSVSRIADTRYPHPTTNDVFFVVVVVIIDGRPYVLPIFFLHYSFSAPVYYMRLWAGTVYAISRVTKRQREQIRKRKEKNGNKSCATNLRVCHCRCKTPGKKTRFF